MSHPIVPAQAVFACDHPGYHKYLPWLGMVNIAPINMVMTWGWFMAMGLPWNKCETHLWEVYWYGWQFMNIRRFGTTQNCDISTSWSVVRRHSFVYFSNLTPGHLEVSNGFSSQSGYDPSLGPLTLWKTWTKDYWTSPFCSWENQP